MHQQSSSLASPTRKSGRVEGGRNRNNVTHVMYVCVVNWVITIRLVQ